MEPEAKLKSLKATRASIKGQMTKLHNYVLAPADKRDIDGFHSKLARAKTLLKQFEDVESSIFDIDSAQESGMLELTKQYYVVESRLCKFIRQYNAGNPDKSQNAVNTSMNLTMTHPVDVRLPKINIEPFSGQYTTWQSFYHLYVKTIHDNTNLSPAQKFQYLKGFLKGDAYNLLRHISITESNYFEAFRKLCARYDRKKHTIKAFIRNFMEQPSIHQANATNIRKLLDSSDEVIRGLKALGKDAESRDVWLITILEDKLDTETRSLWAQTSCEDDLPSLETFFKFLLNRSDALESLRPVPHKRPSNPRTSKVYVTTETTRCPVCKIEHTLQECEKFKQFTVMERRQCVKADNRCFNCLRVNHPVFRCLSSSRCQNCNRKHHTMLHLDDTKEQASTSLSEQSKTTNAHARTFCNSILPTAVVRVVDDIGGEHECRILIDSGSMSTFISEHFCNKLRLHRRNNRTMVSGISGTGNQFTKGIVTLTLRSRADTQKYIEVEALVLNKLCSKLPTQSFKPSVCNMDVFLADPEFNESKNIDLILGVQHVFNILLSGRIKRGQNILAVETIFGWILGGEIETQILGETISNVGEVANTEQNRVEEMLKQFWEVEAIPDIPRLTEEEKKCEELFVRTTYRNPDGRFAVQLPMKHEKGQLGSSVNAALSRQRTMERKFLKDPTIKHQYIEFMNEYHQLGHMVEVNEKDVDNLNYLPHHGILKASKFRVVFDASAKTSNGLSLNDLLMVGPTVQPTLYAILLRFRLHKIAISADVEKMYRQILVREDNRKHQAIVWRANDRETMKYYRLTTLTYGTAAAPYLATRVLNELAATYYERWPLAADVLSKCTYVDDIMAGAANEKDAIELRNRLVYILNTAGLKLRKWISNSDTFLKTVPVEDRVTTIKDFLQDGITVKVLGLQWDPKLDIFSYRVNLGTPVYTKRKLLSESSQIFDPLGWLSPVMIKIKILFQTLWLIAIDWDEELPQTIKQKWSIIRDELYRVEELQIPRWLKTDNCSPNIELHGFCDASERAYAAVIYMRQLIGPDEYTCRLIAAKSKVAPIKKLSVARLELCAAHLLAKLVKSINQILQVTVSSIVCWTDSTIVLDWLSDVPVRWETFVGNRTSQILEVVARDKWRHVPTKDNPADCASRGMLPSELLIHELWWTSPSWLRGNADSWPVQKITYGSREEERSRFSSVLIANCQSISFPLDLVEKLSSYTKVIKTVAIAQRFINNARREAVKHKGPITVTELEEAVKLCCRQVQLSCLVEEILAVKNSKLIKGSTKYLNPYIDDDGILRVGGRIPNSNVAYCVKHPIILPPSKLTTLIIEDYHTRYYHAGPQVMISMLRQKFWILKAKQEIRKVIRRCLQCFRIKPIPLSQEMGNLPACRVQHIRAFLQVGIDFAGPILAFHKRGRGQKPFKSYVCLFVCTSSRAVHIELTTDLTTNAFLAALKRFVARRGLCTDIYSDCGSNFFGAEKQLREAFTFIKTNSNEIYNCLSRESITWHFNPPNAPHFGGLWEAAVKSMKHHLKRVIGETILTVEELQTLLVEIEAILNSRPLCAVPADTEIDILTPGHFIVGHPLVLVPEVNVMNEKVSRLNRWEMLQHMRQHIWQRWHIEYLTTMQSRVKWISSKPNVSVDDIVLLIDRNLPPTKWLLGRIIEVFTGSDGLVRVTTVKTKNGVYRRAIHALCKIPIESGDSKSGRMLEADINLK